MANVRVETARHHFLILNYLDGSTSIAVVSSEREKGDVQAKHDQHISKHGDRWGHRRPGKAMIEGTKYQYGESAEHRDGYDHVLRQALVRKSHLLAPRKESRVFQIQVDADCIR